MRKLIILVSVIFVLAGCKSSYDSASMYDDVYYTPKSNKGKEVTATQTDNSSGLVYGNNASTERFENSVEPQKEYLGTDEYSDYKSYYYTETGDTLPATENTGQDDYYYVEDGYEDYYDYEYASRIDRFHNSYGNFGYYDPCYSNAYYTPGLSFGMGYGMGWPSSYFSVGFGWGYSYYNPWYYDPWYNPYYGGSYWAGYNNGYWNGYYAGGGGYYPGGGGYYPGEGGNSYYPGDYYGPRNSRGSSLSGGAGSRDSRITDGGDDPQNKSYSAGRESRMTGGTTMVAPDVKTTGTTGNERTSREYKPADASSVTNSGTEPQSTKLARPANKNSISSGSGQVQGKASRSVEGTEAQKLAKPTQKTTVSNLNNRNARAQQKYSSNKSNSTPANSRDNGVSSRSKKYAKPSSNSLQKSPKPKNYSSPTYNRPRSGNEYAVPKSRSVNGSSLSGANSRSSSNQGNSNKSRSYQAPSRSNNSFSNPGRQTKTYTSPSRSNSYSKPAKSTRSYSSPSRSSGSYSPRSSGSSSSGSRSSGSSSGSGSRSSGGGGKRGR